MIITTCPDTSTAEHLARLLIESRLAACVQVSGVTSFYTWKGTVAREAEQLLLIKARTDRYPLIEDAIRSNHPYEIPEIIELPIAGGHAAYFSWIDAVSAAQK